jgi:hypothetical protein
LNLGKEVGVKTVNKKIAISLFSCCGARSRTHSHSPRCENNEIATFLFTVLVVTLIGLEAAVFADYDFEM